MILFRKKNCSVADLFQLFPTKTQAHWNSIKYLVTCGYVIYHAILRKTLRISWCSHPVLNLLCLINLNCTEMSFRTLKITSNAIISVSSRHRVGFKRALIPRRSYSVLTRLSSCIMFFQHICFLIKLVYVLLYPNTFLYWNATRANLKLFPQWSYIKETSLHIPLKTMLRKMYK